MSDRKIQLTAQQIVDWVFLPLRGVKESSYEKSWINFKNQWLAEHRPVDGCFEIKSIHDSVGNPIWDMLVSEKQTFCQIKGFDYHELTSQNYDLPGWLSSNLNKSLEDFQLWLLRSNKPVDAYDAWYMDNVSVVQLPIAPLSEQEYGLLEPAHNHPEEGEVLENFDRIHLFVLPSLEKLMSWQGINLMGAPDGSKRYGDIKKWVFNECLDGLAYSYNKYQGPGKVIQERQRFR